MEDIKKDSRFSQIASDPRFQRMPRKERKVKIDKRFKDMFTDKKFKLKYSVDKRGRPIQSTTNENFRKYYDISDSENSSDDEEDLDHQEEEGQRVTMGTGSKTDTVGMFYIYKIILSDSHEIDSTLSLQDTSYILYWEQGYFVRYEV